MQKPVGHVPGADFTAWAHSLRARFDGTVLRPPPPGAAAISATERAALHTWCLDGAGDGRCPLWRPWARPRVERRFGAAVWMPGSEADVASRAEAFARYLDGSDQLASSGRWAGLWLRLRVKLYDAWAWRARSPSDPWDVGWLREDATAWQRFQPRRATLILAGEALSDAAVREAVHTFGARSPGYRHPLRLLIVGRSSAALASSGSPGHSIAITEIAGYVPVDGGAPAVSTSTASASASR